MEEANALQFNWKTSLARVHTLDALKVDEVIFVLFYPTSIEVQYLFDFWVFADEVVKLISFKSFIQP